MRWLLRALAFLAMLPAGVSAAPPPIELDPVRVAAGVYAFIGALEDLSPANQGNVINSGFIVGPTGVVVIDPGPHLRHGQAMLRAIRRVTDLPVALVVDTHPHPENVLGNCAFDAPVMARAEAIAAMRVRCEICFKNTKNALGEDVMAGTRIVMPERAVTENGEVDVAGRRLRLLHFGWAHTEGDLAVFDVESGVLFTGGMVFLDRIPVLLQARTRGWIAALQQLEQLPARIVVPGHGPVSAPGRIRDTRRYLEQLVAVVGRYFNDGASVLEALHGAELPDFQAWALYDSGHPLNIQHVYYELEREDFQRH